MSADNELQHNWSLNAAGLSVCRLSKLYFQEVTDGASSD